MEKEIKAIKNTLKIISERADELNNTDEDISVLQAIILHFASVNPIILLYLDRLEERKEN